MMITHSTATPSVQRLRLLVNGIVQGVGFRPFVYNLAQRLNLSGFVSNSSRGVIIEIEGSENHIGQFLHDLQNQLPPLAEITGIRQQSLNPQFTEGFAIQPSQADRDNQTLIAPDMAICPDCLQELFDPQNRRYLYPFINCTNCGPRYTIIKNIPYDRPFTSMANFRMCPQCQAEYDNPADRRFHAQPNACALCGPRVWYESGASEQASLRDVDAIDEAVTDLAAGKIVAIKGLGGFHLAVDARQDKAVERLRRRKNREEKPLAIMVADLQKARQLTFISERERKLLESPQRPIVLLRKRSAKIISEQVAPGNKRLGIMLPYTPLHYILFARLQERLGGSSPIALVMTSANLSEEPIAISNEDARERLAGIADAFLMHNREILVRADDSVIMEVAKQPLFFRRSRGYVPRPVFIDRSGPSVLALGGELKNTICLLKGDRAFLSQHIGDLENVAANDFFVGSIEYLQKILEVKPQVTIHDLHPAYFSTQWAKEQNEMPTIAVQHHHAHMASCMAEWKLQDPVIGIILDGTGYGYDGTIWGGEILVGDYLHINRLACLEPMPLPGGDAAIREPWRIAYTYLYSALAGEETDLPLFRNRPVDLLRQMLEKKINTPLTSSCGRLFDAVAALSGGKATIRYEAQAAIELMQAAEDLNVSPLKYECAMPYIPVKPIIADVLRALHQGEDFSRIAARFHKTLVDLFIGMALLAHRQTGIDTVVLSGGVFQNEILLEHLRNELHRRGLRVYANQQIPPNDGGIALGQAAIGQKLMLSGQNSVIFETF